MKIIVDKDADALFFRLDDTRIAESEEVRPGIILDFDENNRVVGVEFLGLSARTSEQTIANLQFLTA
jgi:uncharacterized protein YuzE